MSICIAIICDDGETIVSASDRKVTLGSIGVDSIALKSRWLAASCWVLEAGDDMEHSEPIIRRSRQILGDKTDVVDVVEALNDAYWERLHHLIENKVLRKYKFTIDSFRDEGKRKCTTTQYNSLCTKIDKVNIKLEFMVCGFDADERKGHIFVIDGQESPRCYDSIGMWAIGSGAQAALSSLAFQIDRGKLMRSLASVEHGIYFASEAKFMAESSGSVGREDTVVIAYNADDDPLCFHGPDIEPIKQRWLAEGAPKIPADAVPYIAELLGREKAAQDAKDQTGRSDETG